MRAVNTFEKGMITDIDMSRMPPNSSILVQNARVIERDGQGLIVSSIEGTEIKYQLSNGFIPIGHAEYGGILYIVSYNRNIGVDAGKTEIGCFPSPSVWSPDNIDWDNSYKPLNNFRGASEANPNGPLKTDLLDYDLHALEVFGKPSYDGSLDLYICDGIRPNRIINTGFRLTGQSTNRYYWDLTLNTEALQILDSNKVPTIHFSEMDVEEGGSLPPGHIFLHIRYLTKDRNATPFISVHGPFMIDVDSGYLSQGGFDADGLTTTNKLIHVHVVRNLDIGYEYFEVAVVRFWGDVDNGNTSEEWLVDGLYQITDSTYEDLIITGNEKKLPLSSAEILFVNTSTRTCATHIPINDRYYGANWRQQHYDTEALQLYASKILPQYKTVLRPQLYDYSRMTYGFMSFFRGETYPIAVQFLLDTGVWTQGYPIGAYDAYVALTDPHVSNGSEVEGGGLYRFPMYSEVNDLVNNVDYVFQLDFRYDFPWGGESAKQYRDANPDLFANIVGHRFLIGERVPNLICQGIALHGIRGSAGIDGDLLPSWFGFINEAPGIMHGSDSTALTMPMVQQYPSHGCIPAYKSIAGSGDLYSEGVRPYIPEKVNQRFGVIAPDHIIADIAINNGESVYMNVIDRDFFFTNRTETDLLPAEYYAEKGPITGSNARDPKYVEVKLYDVKYDTHHDNDLWMTKALDYSDAGTFEPEDAKAQTKEYSAFLSDVASDRWLSNKSMRTPPYIGVEITDEDYGVQGYQITALAESPAGTYRFTIGTHKFIVGDKFWVTYPKEYGTPSFVNGLLVSAISTNWIEAVDATGQSVTVTGRIMLYNANFINRIVGLYRNDPSLPDYFDTLVSNNSIKNGAKYSVLTNVNEGNPASTFGETSGKGDAFVQVNRFRVMRNTTGINNVYRGGMNSVEKFSHGVVVEYWTENYMNSDMRNETDEFSFWDKASERFTDVEWIYRSIADDAMEESYQINTGYGVPYPYKYYSLVDVLLPYDDLVQLMTIKYSDRHIDGAFIDGFRYIAPENQETFTVGGVITKLTEEQQRLFSVHRNSILLHYTSQQQLKQDPDADDLVMGTGDVLSEQFWFVSDFGSWHGRSIVNGYGYDIEKQTIWKIGGGKGGGFAVVDLLKETNNVTWLNDWIQANGIDETNVDLYQGWVGREIGDYGVIAEFNQRYEEATFIFRGNQSRIFVFNERLGVVTERVHKIPYYQMSLGNDYYTWNGIEDSSNFSYIMLNDSGQVLRWYDPENPLVNQDQLLVIEFYINGQSQEQNALLFSKIWENLEIEADDLEFTLVKWETEFQSGQYDPATDGADFWRVPDYHGHKWFYPMTVQQIPSENFPGVPVAIAGNNYFIDSDLKGTWLKVRLEYTGLAHKILKNVITGFTPAND